MLRRAGVLLLALVLGTGSGAVILAGPATAGGWAATVIDPVDTILPGVAHRVTFWVLQHGTHPYDWSQPASIGSVGLTLTDQRGSRVTFPGKELPEPAHYLATVTVPHAGQWKVVGIQGVFMGYHIGALTVPGTFQPLGVPAAPSERDMQKYWPGKVRPPVLPVDPTRDPHAGGDLDADVVVAPDPTIVPATAAVADRPDPLTGILGGGLVLLIMLALTLAARRRWLRRSAARVQLG